MSNFLNVYPVFEDNQVLTSTQLNEMVAYLDEQSRITRANLLGTGVACGLNLSYATTNSGVNATISFSAGMGITSQGLFINLGACTAVKRRPYTLPVGETYPLFDSPVVLHELLTSDAEVLSTDVITTLTPADCANSAVILFLETVDVDLKSCLGKACDENGLERVFNLRKLLVSKTHLELIKTRSENSGGSDTVPYPAKSGLPEIYMRRPLFTLWPGWL